MLRAGRPPPRSEQGQGFADHIGGHRTFVGLLERGQSSPTFDTINNIARELGLTLSQIFAEMEDGGS